MKHKRPTLLMTVAVLLPATIMYGARFVGSAPANSKAQSANEQTPTLVNFPSTTSTLAELQSNEQGPPQRFTSPFWFEQDQYIAFDEGDAPAPQKQAPVKEFVPEFELTSILPNPKNPLAIIDSKTYRIGDELDGGWKLLTINGQNRTVTIVQKSGKRITLSLTKN